MKTDLQRLNVIRDFLTYITPEEIRKYAYKNFKVRLGAEYGIGTGETATFTLRGKQNAYVWLVTFKRSNRIFRAAWNIGTPSVVWFNGPMLVHNQESGEVEVRSA